MIANLLDDFASTLEKMPRDHPRWRVLSLLQRAIGRDVNFIDRHPTALFQQLWNLCWWCDWSEAAKYYYPPEAGWYHTPPWGREGEKLHRMVQTWREQKSRQVPCYWLRSLRPPPVPLGSALRAVLRGCESYVTDRSVFAGRPACRQRLG
ncbi:MAG: hypothetical protein KatS3mg110_0493 [Pirellulaceae bacterium]|nr:MAG: hypothetical protein KatS3mg110_0493 [Pirellulaceae bacterium]